MGKSTCTNPACIVEINRLRNETLELWEKLIISEDKLIKMKDKLIKMHEERLKINRPKSNLKVIWKKHN